MMPIPGDELRGMALRGFRVIARALSDAVIGIKGKAGNIKASPAEGQQFSNSVNYMQDLMFGDPSSNVLKNSKLVDQNNLEAFYVAHNKAIAEGDELSLSGIDAIRSRYYFRELDTEFTKGNNIMSGFESDGAKVAMLKDARDVAAAAASAIVGFKATWSAVSLVVGRDD